MASRGWERGGILLILLTAAAVRFIGLNNISPPGLAHDEVAHWLIVQNIRAGHYAIYFTDAYGHEGLFHYWQTLLVILIGDNALGLRLPAAFCGLLIVAVTYVMGRELFGRTVGLWSMAITAVLFYPVFYSRLGLRAITLALFGSLFIYFWWRGWQGHGRVPLNYLLAGLCAGLASYTYMASRALPIFLVALYLYLLWAHRPRLRQAWRGHIGLLTLYLLISLPLVLYLQTITEVRVAEVDGPLRAFLAGDPRPALSNLAAILLSWGWQGDPLWRQNVAGWPTFDPLLALLFYGGLGYALWQAVRYPKEDARAPFLLLWLGASLVPSVVTIDAPSSIRLIMGMPILPLFISWPLARFIPRFTMLSPQIPQLSTVFTKNLWITGLTFFLLLLHGGRTGYGLAIWAANEEVAFVWQAAFTEMADYVAQWPGLSAATAVGWTPDSMDSPTLHLLSSRREITWRHVGQVGAVSTAVIPAAGGVILRPSLLPFEPLLEESLRGISTAEPFAEGLLTIYPLPAHWVPTPEMTPDTAVPFGDELLFLGHDLRLDPRQQEWQMLSYWQVTAVAPPTAPRRFFLHQLDESGHLLDQDDGLAAPPEFWQQGDVLIHYHRWPQTPEAAVWQLGVYEPIPPYPRLTTAVGDSFHRLQLPHPSTQSSTP